MKALSFGLAFSLATSQLANAQIPASARVAILLFDGVQIIDFTGPYEIFGQAGFDVYSVSETGGSVETAMEMSVNVDYDFESAPDADILLIPGGDIDTAMTHPATLEFVRTRSASAKHVLSVCTGSFILAATGLLDGGAATTYHRSFESMASRFPRVEILRDRRWVDSGKLVTAAGLASGIDAALHIVAEVRGEEAARTVAMNLEYDWSADDREGFIRGLQADQHLRYPVDLAFPADTEARIVVSFGDERQWQQVVRLKSALEPGVYIEQLRERVAADPALRLLPSSGSRAIRWGYSDAAGDWELSLIAKDADESQTFELFSALERVRP